jgi:hypothetical protein
MATQETKTASFVTSEMLRLGDVISTLEKQVTHLENRIGDALVPLQPMPPATAEVQPVESHSDLGIAVSRQADRVLDVIATLCRIVGRLEL